MTPERSTPDGIRRVTYFLPSTTSVWPAFAPPAQRTTYARPLGQQVDDLALPLVAPLRPDDDYDGHVVFPLPFAHEFDSSAPATASTSTAKPTAGLGRP